MAGAPAGDVQAVDPVVEDVDRDGDQEHPDAPLHQPQRPPVDAVAAVAVEDHQADDHGGAGGVEQVRRGEVVAQPAEVPGDVPGRAEHLEQEGAEPGGVDPAQLGLGRRPARAARRHVGQPEPAHRGDGWASAAPQRAGRRRDRRAGRGRCSRRGHGNFLGSVDCPDPSRGGPDSDPPTGAVTGGCGSGGQAGRRGRGRCVLSGDVAESAGHLVWIDCEMTGLDIVKDKLIEVAVARHRLRAQRPRPGPGPDHRRRRRRPRRHERGRPRDARKSGLTDAVRASTLTVAEAEQQVLAYIKRWVPDRRTAPLCGNSIGTDRGFLARDMPELDDHLHYRMVDVSSVKELARRWFPRVYFAQPPKGLAHRALADIIESRPRARLLPPHAVRARPRPEQRPGEGARPTRSSAPSPRCSPPATPTPPRTPPARRDADAPPGARSADRLRYRCAGSPPALASGRDMVGVAQLVEHQVVILGVAGSSPVTHPMRRGPGQVADQGLSRSPRQPLEGTPTGRCPRRGRTGGHDGATAHPANPRTVRPVSRPTTARSSHDVDREARPPAPRVLPQPLPLPRAAVAREPGGPLRCGGWPRACAGCCGCACAPC